MKVSRILTIYILDLNIISHFDSMTDGVSSLSSSWKQFYNIVPRDITAELSDAIKKLIGCVCTVGLNIIRAVPHNEIPYLTVGRIAEK